MVKHKSGRNIFIGVTSRKHLVVLFTPHSNHWYQIINKSLAGKNAPVDCVNFPYTLVIYSACAHGGVTGSIPRFTLLSQVICGFPPGLDMAKSWMSSILLIITSTDWSQSMGALRRYQFPWFLLPMARSSALFFKRFVGRVISKSPFPCCVCTQIEWKLDGTVEKLMHGDPKIQDGVINILLVLEYFLVRAICRIIIGFIFKKGTSSGVTSF